MYRGSFHAVSSLLPLAVPPCSETGAHVHALIKGLAIRRAGQNSEIHSNESSHLAEATETTHVQRCCFFSFNNRLCRPARGIIFADRVKRLLVASSSGRKTRRPYKHAISSGEPVPRHGKEGTVTGTWMRMGTGARTGTRRGARTWTETGTGRKGLGEGGDISETHQTVIEVEYKT